MKIDNEIRLSFWFMRDDHTFYKVKGKSLIKIAKDMKSLAKQNPSGMVCPVTVLSGDKELGRIGNPAHVDMKGNVNIDEWLDSIQGEYTFNETGIVKTYKVKL